MKIENNDVLVVGGGLAGCAAAAAAAEAGKKVTMIFPNGGASEFSSGCLDIAGVIPGEEPEIVAEYADGVAKLACFGHPYATAGVCLDDSVKVVTALAAEGGYRLCGFEGKNVWLPNIMGTFTIAAYVPSVSSNTAFSKGSRLSVLIIGFEGHVAFSAQAAALSYRKYQKKLGLKNEYYSVIFALDGMKGRCKVTDGELADYFDTEAGVSELAAKINAFLSNNLQNYDLILLPPVLGFVAYSKAVETLEASCGKKFAEVLTGYNAVIGYRMTRAIYKGLNAKGVSLLKGSRALGIKSCNDGVCVDTVIGLTDQLHLGVRKELKAKALVLATGGFIGGGIEARRREVWISLLEENLGQVGSDILDRNPVNGKGQDVLKLGAKVTEKLEVADPSYMNRVFACGDLLCGFNPVSERSGSGVALASGWLAGKHAAEIV